ncbi:MAG TPA: hypothetical protein VGN16_09540 [Acidobacteriaceae bacterium]|jgi:tetrahydromethanopterin S-methyltransferase subunit G
MTDDRYEAIREDYARQIGRVRDASFLQGMVCGILIALLAAAFLFITLR